MIETINNDPAETVQVNTVRPGLTTVNVLYRNGTNRGAQFPSMDQALAFIQQTQFAHAQATINGSATRINAWGKNGS